MRRVDVLVVGGGPAGSTLAWVLARGGVQVAVADRARFPRDKVCAGWITPAVVQALGLDLGRYADDRVLQPITGFRVGMLGADPRLVDLGGEVVSYGIRRHEFDHYLLQRAAEAGAELWLGEAIRTARRQPGGWILDDAIQCRLLVGAGGHFCPVARLLNAEAGRRDGPVVAAKEVEFRLSPEQAAACPVAPERPELWFTPDLAGYGWVFRKGEWLNVGLGREDRQGLGRHLRAFVATLREQGRLPPGLPDRFPGHAYLLYPHARRPLAGERALLLGDAAGLAHPRSGEGIRPAVESALLAAAAILEQGIDGPAPEAYRRRIEGRFGPRQPGDGWVERLPAGVRQRAARRLMGLPWFVRRVVVERWFLQRDLPPLESPRLT